MSSRFSWRRPTPPQLDYNTSMSMRQGVQRVGFMPFLRKGKANIELRHLSSLIKVNLPTWMYRVSSVLEGRGHVYRFKTDTVQKEASENRESERILVRQ